MNGFEKLIWILAQGKGEKEIGKLHLTDPDFSASENRMVLENTSQG